MASIDDVIRILRDIDTDVQTIIGRIQINPTQIVLAGLADISKNMGLIQAGEFRVGNSVEPGFGFTGARYGWPGFEYNSETWVLAGVEDDVLRIGINITDGKLYAEEAVISGTITATAGAIGGWTIDSSSIRKLSSNVGIILDSGTPKIQVGDTAGVHIVIDGANQRIRSSNYSAGLSGFNIDTDSGDAEFNNLVARGKITTAVFEKNVISAVGGSMLILPADVLNVDMTAADNSTLTIIGDETFAVGDILRMKDDTDDEWFEVTNIASAPTYVVTRDKAAQYSANANPAWKKGQAIVNYGQSGDGGILIEGGVTPRMVVFTHGGSPWSSITEQAVMEEGALRSGAGEIVLDATGMSILQGSVSVGTIDPSMIYWRDGSDNVRSYIQDSIAGGSSDQFYVEKIRANGATPTSTQLILEMLNQDTASTETALITMTGSATETYMEFAVVDNVITMVNNRIEINSGGADVDTVIEGDNNSQVFIVDGGLDAVGILSAAQSGYALKVGGKINLTTGNTYDINGTPHTHTNQTTEEIQDIIGAMVTGNIESGISVTYDDTNGKLDFVVNGGYFNTTTWAEQGSDPSTPAAGEWVTYFKGDGLYQKDDAGIVTGPLLAVGGWHKVDETWTRTGDHTFTVSGDVTATYRKGTKVRYKDGGSYEYGVVGAVSHAAGTTTVTLITNTSYAMAAATITDRYISYIENPEGFPETFNFTPTGLVTIGNGTQTARWKTLGTRIFLEGHITYGSTTTFGSSDLTLPVAVDSFYPTGGSRFPLGICIFLDAAVAVYFGNAVYLSSGPAARIQVQPAGGTYVTTSVISSTVPMTWGTSDELSFNIAYDF